MVDPTNEAWRSLLEKKLPVLLHYRPGGFIRPWFFTVSTPHVARRVLIPLWTGAGNPRRQFYPNYAYLIARILPRRSLLPFLVGNLLAMALMDLLSVMIEGALLHPGYFLTE